MQGKKKKTLAVMETISNADLLFVLYCTSSANSIYPPSHHSRPCRRYSLPMQVIYSQYSSSRRHLVASAIRLPHHPHRQMKLPSSSSCSRASPPPLASLLYNTPNTPYNVSSLSECLEAASGSPPSASPCRFSRVSQSRMVACLTLHHSLAATLLIRARFDRLLVPPVWVAPPQPKTPFPKPGRISSLLFGGAARSAARFQASSLLSLDFLLPV